MHHRRGTWNRKPVEAQANGRGFLVADVKGAARQGHAACRASSTSELAATRTSRVVNPLVPVAVIVTSSVAVHSPSVAVKRRTYAPASEMLAVGPIAFALAKVTSPARRPATG
jgi:hypothetical protein